MSDRRSEAALPAGGREPRQLGWRRGAHLRRHLHLPARTIDVVANGAEPLSSQSCMGRRSAARRDLGLGDEELAIVKVANLWPYKGYQDLIEALARVRDAGQTRAFFVGGDRGFGSVLTDEIEKRGLSDRIRFLGERSDVCALLPAFDIYVSASHGEGMSNAVMEAMQHALPVVGSRVAGTPELLDHGAAGCLFEPGDVSGLAGAILDLARDPRKAAASRGCGEARIREEFSEGTMVRETLEVYGGDTRRAPGASRTPRASLGGRSARREGDASLSSVRAKLRNRRDSSVSAHRSRGVPPGDGENRVSGPDRFAFGRNWAKFLSVVNDERILEAEKSLRAMLEQPSLSGVRFLDMGSGSGLFSLAARRLGAHVRSFDYDPESVACTAELKRRYFPDDSGWTVERGSALDAAYVRSLGVFDVVYSWGVLHHTGRMWDASGTPRSRSRRAGGSSSRSTTTRASPATSGSG